MEIKAAILGAGNMGKSHAKRLLESGALVSCVCDRSRTAEGLSSTRCRGKGYKEKS